MPEFEKIERVERRRDTPQVEFEHRLERIINQRTGRLEDVLSGTITVNSIAMQRGVRISYSLDKQTLDALTQNALENYNEGRLNAFKVFRIQFLEGITGVTDLVSGTRAGSVASRFVGAWGNYEVSKNAVRKSVNEHRYQLLKMMLDEHQQAKGRDRSKVEQNNRLLHEMAQSLATAVSNILVKI